MVWVDGHEREERKGTAGKPIVRVARQELLGGTVLNQVSAEEAAARNVEVRDGPGSIVSGEKDLSSP